MTNDDRVAGLGTALEPQDRKNDSKVNIGGLMINRKDGRKGYGAEVAEVLLSSNGTYVWDLDDPQNGSGIFDSIYEKLAADIHAPMGSVRTRVEVAQERAHEARAGITALAKWLDEQWGIPLYRCNPSGTGKKITVVTINPDFVVNEDTGETASELQQVRDRKAVAGQLNSSFKRLGRERGEAYARGVLEEAVRGVLADSLPAPRKHSRIGRS